MSFQKQNSLIFFVFENIFLAYFVLFLIFMHLLLRIMETLIITAIFLKVDMGLFKCLLWFVDHSVVQILALWFEFYDTPNPG